MKHNFKNYIKLSILLLGVFAITFSCEKDNLNEEEISSNRQPPNLTATIERGGKLLNSNLTLKNQLSTFTKKKGNTTNSNISYRTIYSNEYGFSIDTTYIQKIETSTYSSFTFNVERNDVNLNVLENYVITYFNDDTFQQLLISYPILDTGFDIANATGVFINDNSLLYSIAARDCGFDVPEYTQPICITYTQCSLPTGGGHHDFGDGTCSATGDDVATGVCTQGGWVEGVDNCTDGPSTAGDGTPSGSGTGAETGTGGSPPNTNNNGNGEVTVVVPLSPYAQSIVDCINSSSIGQTDNTTIDPNILNSVGLADQKLISVYLNQNGCSENAQVFAILAAEAIEGSEVDFANEIIIDDSLNNTETKCIHNKLANDPNINFYKLMLSTFSSSNFETLRIELGNTINGNDWGVSAGHTINNSSIGFDFYNIKINSEIENSSNLSQIVTLSHELIHVFLFNSLDNLGIITYDTNGIPEFNTIQCNNFQPNVNINSLSIKDRWIALICAYNSNNPQSDDWTHDLFNTATFILNNYKSDLENLILNFHDWDNETPILKAFLQSEFGSLWKEKTAEYISWKGLEKTDEFISWAQNNNIASTTDINGEVIFPTYNAIISFIRTEGKSNCQ